MRNRILKVTIGNVHNIGKRESQQDSFGISDLSNKKLCKENGIFAVVADGMGGLSGGAQISAIVTSRMLSYFAGSKEKESPKLLLNMLFDASLEVRNYLMSQGNQHSGSTVVSVLIRENELYFLTVGDSRIYLHRGGELLLLNREHIYGSELDEKAAKGEITVDEARNDPQRSALTSYIGMEHIALIDRNLHPVTLMKGDRILLMSDGIFGTLTGDEIGAVAKYHAYDAAISMEKAVLKKEKSNQDNFTSIIIELE